MMCCRDSIAVVCRNCHATEQECDFWDGQCSGPFKKKANPMACVVAASFLFCVGLCVILAIWFYVLGRLV